MSRRAHEPEGIPENAVRATVLFGQWEVSAFVFAKQDPSRRRLIHEGIIREGPCAQRPARFQVAKEGIPRQLSKITVVGKSTFHLLRELLKDLTRDVQREHPAAATPSLRRVASTPGNVRTHVRAPPMGSRASVILTARLFWQFHAVLLPWQVLGVTVWAVLASW